MFSIDNENTITYHDAPPAPTEGLIVFSNDRDLDRNTADQPLSRLAQIWNGFAGIPPFGDLKPVKKFENRIIATRRIWDAVQKLAPAVNGTSTAFPNATQPTATQSQAEDAAAEAAGAVDPTAPAVVDPLTPCDEPAVSAPAVEAAAAKPAAKKPATKKPAAAPAKKAPKAEPKPKAKTDKTTAKDKVIAMISRKGGASLDEIIKATDWLPHTTRAFISILGSKHGIKINSTRRESDKARVYEIAK